MHDLPGGLLPKVPWPSTSTLTRLSPVSGRSPPDLSEGALAEDEGRVREVELGEGDAPGVVEAGPAAAREGGKSAAREGSRERRRL